MRDTLFAACICSGAFQASRVEERANVAHRRRRGNALGQLERDDCRVGLGRNGHDDRKPRAVTDAFWATAIVMSPSVATRGSPSDWNPIFRALDSRLVMA